MATIRQKGSALLCVLATVAFCCASNAAQQSAAEIARAVSPLMGTSWYGVYFLGEQKCGFARITIQRGKVGEEDVYTCRMLMDVDVRMGKLTQKIVVNQARHYNLTGELTGLESSTTSALGKVVVRGEVKGNKLLLRSTTAGHTSTSEVPAPNESLNAVLAGQRLVRQGKLGETLEFEVYEPSLGKTVAVSSKLLRFEQRLIGGIKTRIGVVQSSYKGLGMKTTEYVTAEGELLETVVGNMFTLRMEPEKVARDVGLAFDAIRASTIPIDERLGDRRRIVSLKLRLSGIPGKEALINDARQSYEPGGEGRAAEHMVTLKMAQAPKDRPTLPLKLGPGEEEVARFLEPSALAQSDAPEIIKTARGIVGDSTDPFEAAAKVLRWVHQNVEKKYMAAMSNALGVLKRMEGDCSEHTALFVALCRAAGIPARQVVGIGYSDEIKAFGYHAWAEVYVGRWVAMDPTWGENLVDATHLKFGAGGAESLGAVAGLFGSLKIKVIEVER